MGDMTLVVHPPLAVRRTGTTEHSVAEVRPDSCDRGHPLAVVLVGWQPCRCGGHRTVECRCGEVMHFHAGDEPRPSCTPARTGFAEETGK